MKDAKEKDYVLYDFIYMKNQLLERDRNKISSCLGQDWGWDYQRTGETFWNEVKFSLGFPMAQLVKSLPAMWETQV